MKINKKIIALTILSAGIMMITQSFAIKDRDEKAVNL